jgi:hypothetical protein
MEPISKSPSGTLGVKGEGVHGHHVLQLTVNGKQFEWRKQYITGAEIRDIGNIPIEDEIFLSVKKPWEDELVLEDTKVNLARPEIEHFYSKKKDVKVTLVVNGKQKPWSEKQITFEQIVVLAFGKYDPNPNICYTVTYDRGPRQNLEGSMVKGDEVFVQNKMIFNVSATDKS